MVEGETQALPESEAENKIQRWGYETRFKYYLYRIGILGNEGVESIKNFPTSIELDDIWHGTLNRMREESRDGFERAIPVGYREDRRSVYLPQDFSRGTNTGAVIPSPEEVKAKFGIEHQFGAIHSHPDDWLSTVVWKALEATRLGDGTGFSLEDIFYMVDGKGLPMEAVVERNANYFAFRTQETKEIPEGSPLSSKEAFLRHWYRKHGMWAGSNRNFMVALKLPVSVRKININLAEAYNLALYRGNPGEKLVREYPQI